MELREGQSAGFLKVDNADILLPFIEQKRSPLGVFIAIAGPSGTGKSELARILSLSVLSNLTNNASLGELPILKLDLSLAPRSSSERASMDMHDWFIWGKEGADERLQETIEAMKKRQGKIVFSNTFSVSDGCRGHISKPVPLVAGLLVVDGAVALAPEIESVWAENNIDPIRILVDSPKDSRRKWFLERKMKNRGPNAAEEAKKDIDLLYEPAWETHRKSLTVRPDISAWSDNGVIRLTVPTAV
jgi:hypothetical protein